MNITQYIKLIGKFAYTKLIEYERRQKKESLVNKLEEKEKLKSFSPQVVLYMSGDQASAYQGNMWLKVLEKLDANVVIVLRNYNLIYGLHETTLPVFFLPDYLDLELLEDAGVKTILYTTNAMKVTQALRLYRLNHYFINHGESDKVVNQSKLLMAYDKLLLSGELAKKRLIEANLPLRENQIIYVGRPLVELLLSKSEKSGKKVKTILYAPTWEGFLEEANYSSINKYGISLVKELVKMSNEIKIYFKAHPFTARTDRGSISSDYETIKELIKDSNIELIKADKSIYKYMNMSDLMITDISSTITDYLYTDKPMILTNSNNDSIEYLHKNFESTKALHILNNTEELHRTIHDIVNDDNLNKEREKMKNYILGNIPEGYLNKFNKTINDSII